MSLTTHIRILVVVAIVTIGGVGAIGAVAAQEGPTCTVNISLPGPTNSQEMGENSEDRAGNADDGGYRDATFELLAGNNADEQAGNSLDKEDNNDDGGTNACQRAS